MLPRWCHFGNNKVPIWHQDRLSQHNRETKENKKED
jgi:hypothetical protein